MERRMGMENMLMRIYVAMKETLKIIDLKAKAKLSMQTRINLMGTLREVCLTVMGSTNMQTGQYMKGNLKWGKNMGKGNTKRKMG